MVSPITETMTCPLCGLEHPIGTTYCPFMYADIPVNVLPDAKSATVNSNEVVACPICGDSGQVGTDCRQCGELLPDSEKETSPALLNTILVERAEETLPRVGAPRIGYRPSWSPKLITSPQMLAAQVREHWEDAAQQFGGRTEQKLIDFLESFPNTTEALRVVRSEETAGQKLVKLQHLLDPTTEILFSGYSLSDKSFADQIGEAQNGNSNALQWLADIFEGNILTAVAEVTGDDHLAEADYHLQNLHTQVKGFIDRFIVEIDDAKKTYQAPGLPYEALADEVKLNFSKSQYNDNRKIYVKLQSAVLKLMPKLYPNLQQLSVSYKTIVYPVLPSLFSVTLKPQIGGAVPSVDEIKHQLSVVTEFLNDEINRNTSAVLDDLTSTFGMIGLLSGMLQDSMASALSGKFGRLNSSAVKDIADMAEKNPQYELKGLLTKAELGEVYDLAEDMLLVSASLIKTDNQLTPKGQAKMAAPTLAAAELKTPAVLKLKALEYLGRRLDSASGSDLEIVLGAYAILQPFTALAELSANQMLIAVAQSEAKERAAAGKKAIKESEARLNERPDSDNYYRSYSSPSARSTHEQNVRNKALRQAEKNIQVAKSWYLEAKSRTTEAESRLKTALAQRAKYQGFPNPWDAEVAAANTEASDRTESNAAKHELTVTKAKINELKAEQAKAEAEAADAKSKAIAEIKRKIEPLIGSPWIDYANQKTITRLTKSINGDEMYSVQQIENQHTRTKDLAETQVVELDVIKRKIMTMQKSPLLTDQTYAAKFTVNIKKLAKLHKKVAEIRPAKNFLEVHNTARELSLITKEVTSLYSDLEAWEKHIPKVEELRSMAATGQRSLERVVGIKAPADVEYEVRWNDVKQAAQTLKTASKRADELAGEKFGEGFDGNTLSSNRGDGFSALLWSGKVKPATEELKHAQANFDNAVGMFNRMCIKALIGIVKQVSDNSETWLAKYSKSWFKSAAIKEDVAKTKAVTDAIIAKLKFADTWLVGADELERSRAELLAVLPPDDPLFTRLKDIPEVIV